MKTTRLFILIALSTGALFTAQAQDRAQIEKELARLYDNVNKAKAGNPKAGKVSSR